MGTDERRGCSFHSEFLQGSRGLWQADLSPGYYWNSTSPVMWQFFSSRMRILNVQAGKRAPEAEFNQIKTTKGNGNHILAEQQRMNDIMYHKNKASFIKGLKKIIYLQYLLDVQTHSGTLGSTGARTKFVINTSQRCLQPTNSHLLQNHHV